MGLERLAVVCQDVDSLFDVDTVMNITHKVSEITSAYYGKSHKMDVSLRVITDHIRSATFMICDGVLPSNEGRGYVLRRLLRRAARHGKLLGVNEPFLYRIVDTVVHENECQYPELREKQSYITRVIKVEEENFAKTIDGGMRIFSDLLAAHKAKGEQVFSGEDAFKLYDTYGFPIDLTSEMLEEEEMTVDLDGFQKLMEAQRQRARKAREALGDLGWAGNRNLSLDCAVFCADVLDGLRVERECSHDMYLLGAFVHLLIILRQDRRFSLLHYSKDPGNCRSTQFHRFSERRHGPRCSKPAWSFARPAER